MASQPDSSAKPALFEVGIPRMITFRSAIFKDNEGEMQSAKITVQVRNGDVLGILKVVEEQGGIGEFDTHGNYIYIPWPCAVVEVSEVGGRIPIPPQS